MKFLSNQSLKNVMVLGSLISTLIAGCSTPTNPSPAPAVKQPTPTLNPYFSKQDSTVYFLDLPNPGITSTEQTIPGVISGTQGLQSTGQPGIQLTTEPTPTQVTQPITVTVFDERLNPGWTLNYSQGVTLTVPSEVQAFQGSESLEFKPQQDYGRLFFSVISDTLFSYPRENVKDVSFWLYSDEPVGTQDLAVSVVGSNQYPYWVEGDTSVTNSYDPVFPETRLVYLGFNDAIPAKTWVQVDVQLDKLLYEPDYRYVTGIYIINDIGFRQTVYIDRVELITTGLAGKPASTPGPGEAGPQLTPTPTPTPGSN